MALVPKKLRPGYTFHNEVTGVALQRSLPDANGETETVAINKDGGVEPLPGPFVMVDAEMAKKQAIKFEDPTEAEMEILKKANAKELEIKIAPPVSPMKTVHVDDKAMKVTPQDKEVKAKDEAAAAPPKVDEEAMSLAKNSAQGSETRKKKKKK